MPFDTDAELFGLTRLGSTGFFEFEVTPPLSRMDDRLYGGTAIAVSIAAAEAVSERSALWMTTQYVGTVATGTRMGLEAEVLAPGRRTNQVRVTGKSPAGDVVFASLGATGHLRSEGLTGTFDACPEVAPPDDAEPWTSPFAGLHEIFESVGVAPPQVEADRGFNAVFELRAPELRHHPDPGPGRTCLWARRADGGPITPAVAAFIADMVPMSVARALGEPAVGVSLDNTIRVAGPSATDWVLIDLRPHLAAGDYGHGTAHVWDATGQLVATASQTASMRRLDPSAPPWAAP